ncbi:MAG: hypothetical protein IJT12_10190 [Paludibacteraceae bacterium]|nr:hypothetical protein [Paludibacteraceae bacterium]
MKKIFYLMLVVVLAGSCATGYYAPHNVNQFGTQTQVVLSEAVFRVLFGLPKITQHVAARGTVIEFLDKNGNPIQSVTNQGAAPRVSIESGSQNQGQHATATSSNLPIAQNASAAQQVSPLLNSNGEEFVPVAINPQWGSSTKKIAKTYNESHHVDAIYDFNEDGIISEEELEYINFVLCDSKKAPNKQVFFEMAHKDYENTVGRLRRNNNQ